MADIELVVKIDEDDYKKVLEINNRECEGEWNNMHRCYEAILNGTPLPKGHGRLIDVDELDITAITTDDYSGNEMLDIVLKEDVDDAPTIIEADKAESEG